MADTIRLIRNTEQVSAMKKPEEGNNKNRYIGLGILGATLLGLAFYWFVFSANHITTNNAYIQADVFPINARIMGYVKEVLVQDNAQVKEGDPLVHLDEADLKIELSFKQAKYDKALMDVTRARRLKKSGAVSDSDMELAEATLTSHKADLDGTLAKLKYTWILAPADGIIGKKNVQPGQFVQPGQGLIALVSNKSIWVKANFKETQISKLHLGQLIHIDIDAFPGIEWEGKLDSLFPSSGAVMSLLPPENATGNFTKIVQHFSSKITLNAEQYSLEAAKHLKDIKPGMSATVSLEIQPELK